MNIRKMSLEQLAREYDYLYEWRNQEADALREIGETEEFILASPKIARIGQLLYDVRREMVVRERNEIVKIKLRNFLHLKW